MEAIAGAGRLARSVAASAHAATVGGDADGSGLSGGGRRAAAATLRAPMLAALVALVAVAAVAPLWPAAVRRGGGVVARALLSVFAAGVVVTTFVHWPVPSPPPATRPAVVAADGYVGSAACRSCHPAEHASWHGSHHRTMTQLATRTALVARFDRLELDWFGSPVLLEWRGDELWTRFERAGRQPAPVDARVEQLTGSHHLQVLWYSTGNGRELAPVPMVFKLAEARWLPLTTVFVLPPEYRDPPEPGAWSQSCSGCHATHVRPRFDASGNDTHVAELGIACEACHGPGAAHVAANQNPLRRYAQRAAGRDPTVFEPSTALPVRSAQACGHCHAVSILRQQHFVDWPEHGSPFRPGRDLHQSHLVVDPTERDAPELRRELQHNPHFFASSFWSDGEVRLSGREFSGLRRSPCYTHGDTSRQLDCTSCHQMHQPDGRAPRDWRDDQLRPGARGNGACTQCHEELAAPEALAAHTHHAPESIGSRCYDCHMSHTSIGLTKASRSHTITSPSVASELATGRPNACNQCHLDRSLQWTAQHLEAWWGIAAPPLDAEQRTVAAGVRWLLTGDAGQRLLAAWSFGWQPAWQASGTDWLVPYLARLLDDPYYVVRFAAERSLRDLGHGDGLAGYDFVAAASAARTVGERLHARWAQGPPPAARPATLLPDGVLDQAAFERLFARRDDRPVYLAE